MPGNAFKLLKYLDLDFIIYTVSVKTANSSERYGFGSSNSDDYISLVNLLADYYNSNS